MIDKSKLEAFIQGKLEGTELWLVETTVSPSNAITVEIDSDNGVDIDSCVELTRAIEAEFDRDAEDYELEVGSAGLTSPFKVLRQYRKNIGREVETVTAGGKKYKGTLLAAGPESFTLACTEKVKPEGAKKAVMQTVEHTFGYGDVKQTRCHIDF